MSAPGALTIDRAAFLAVTAALATVACRSAEPPVAATVAVPVAPLGEPPPPASPIAHEEAPPLAPGKRLDCAMTAPTCEGANWARRTCIRAGERKLPEKALTRLDACLQKNLADKKAICSVEATDACTAEAIALVPPASGTDGPCRRVVAACPKTSMAECQGVLSVRPVPYRDRAVFCLIGPANRCNSPGWCAFGDPDTTFLPPP